jgi:hypothetical protein
VWLASSFTPAQHGVQRGAFRERARRFCQLSGAGLLTRLEHQRLAPCGRQRMSAGRPAGQETLTSAERSSWARRVDDAWLCHQGLSDLHDHPPTSRCSSPTRVRCALNIS